MTRFGTLLVAMAAVTALPGPLSAQENDDSEAEAICLIIDAEGIPRWGSESAAEVVCQEARDRNVAVGKLTRERGDAERVLGVKLMATPEGFFLKGYYIVGDQAPQWYSTSVSGPDDLHRAAEVLVSSLMPVIEAANGVRPAPPRVAVPAMGAAQLVEEPPAEIGKSISTDEPFRLVFWLSGGMGSTSVGLGPGFGAGWEVGGFSSGWGLAVRKQNVASFETNFVASTLSIVPMKCFVQDNIRLGVGAGLSLNEELEWPGLAIQARIFGVKRWVGVGGLVYVDINEEQSYFGASLEFLLKFRIRGNP